jgi:hypothetical protein
MKLRPRASLSWWLGAAGGLSLSIFCAAGQSLIVSDHFESAGSTVGITNGPLLRLRFIGRKNAAVLGRRFVSSSDLAGWSELTPSLITDVQDSGNLVVREVTFPVSSSAGFYRAAYGP